MLLLSRPDIIIQWHSPRAVRFGRGATTVLANSVTTRVGTHLPRSRPSVTLSRSLRVPFIVSLSAVTGEFILGAIMPTENLALVLRRGQRMPHLLAVSIK